MEGCRSARLDEPASRLAGCREMIQITAQMRVLVAIEPVDGRKGIDSLARLCQEKLAEDPFSGCVFVFRSRSGTSIRLLSYGGQAAKWYDRVADIAVIQALICGTEDQLLSGVCHWQWCCGTRQL